MRGSSKATLPLTAGRPSARAAKLGELGARGDGVAAEHRELIFQRGHSGGESSGVGLHISKKLVESQGGELHVTNRHGGGALFTFTVPPGVRTDTINLRSVESVAS